ncbi:MAG: glycosyltransferase family 2 protein [Bryobacterales bacterium]
MRPEAPLVSVIIPLYHSETTLGGCLDALAAQTERRFETILIDSSETDAARAIAERHANVDYLHLSRRLWPQAARNFGAERARGRLFVFTDPDIYPRPEWLAQLVQSHERAPGIVFGPIACHGRRWVDRGVHLCKFNICLPGTPAGPVALGWSGNVLVARETFEALGGWDTVHTQGDSVFSARARRRGIELRLEPAAVVDHDHEGVALAALIRERAWRGREFAEMEAAGELDTGDQQTPPTVGRALVKAAAMPFRVGGALLRIGRSAARAGMADEFFVTLPVVTLGVAGWYAGMAAGWLRSIRLRAV